MPLPNKYLGVGYKDLFFCRNNEKHGQGTHSTKMGADSRPENNPNASKNLILKMSAQAQKFKIFEKSSISLGVRSPW